LTQDKSTKKFYQKNLTSRKRKDFSGKRFGSRGIRWYSKKFFRNKKFDKQEKRKRFFQDGKDFLTKKDLTGKVKEKTSKGK
jgi:hypothetical protein